MKPRDPEKLIVERDWDALIRTLPVSELGRLDAALRRALPSAAEEHYARTLKSSYFRKLFAEATGRDAG